MHIESYTRNGFSNIGKTEGYLREDSNFRNQNISSIWYFLFIKITRLEMMYIAHLSNQESQKINLHRCTELTFSHTQYWLIFIMDLDIMGCFSMNNHQISFNFFSVVSHHCTRCTISSAISAIYVRISWDFFYPDSAW